MRLRNAVQLWTKMYTEMGWCDDMRAKLESCMLLHATTQRLRTGAVVSAMCSLMWLSRRIRTATTHTQIDYCKRL